MSASHYPCLDVFDIGVHMPKSNICLITSWESIWRYDLSERSESKFAM